MTTSNQHTDGENGTVGKTETGHVDLQAVTAYIKYPHADACS